MRGEFRKSAERPILTAFACALILTGPAWAQQAQQSTSAASAMKGGPVVRTFGAAGGFRTEVTSETKGTLSQEDRRQVSLLMAQVFQHVDEARRAVDAADLKRARNEVHKAQQAIQVIRDLLPRTMVHTKTTAPNGQVVYEDDREVQENRILMFEGMLVARTFAPILAAKREQQASEATDIAGIQVVESEVVTTEVITDLNLIETQLNRRPSSHSPAMRDIDLFSRLLPLQQPWRVERVKLDPKHQRIDVRLAHRRNAAFRGGRFWASPA